MENLQKEKLLKKIGEGEGIPSLSPLAIQLVELAADDSISAQDLADIIEKDPGLTTRLLKLVGSAFFARPKQVTSIAQAIVLLGFKRLRIMALSLSLRDTFPMGKAKGIDYDHFWKTSLYRALVAQEFARASDQPDMNPDEAFIGGLILEIGMLMLYEVYPEGKKENFPGWNLTLEEAISLEEQILGINHREVGNLTLQRWRFPEDLVKTQRHFGVEAMEPDKPILCRVVELARRATETIFIHTNELYDLQELAQGLIKRDHETVNKILSDAFNKVEAFADQLRFRVDSQTERIEVLENANKALARINFSMETSLQGLLDHVSEYDRSLTEISVEMAQRRKVILQNTLDAVAHEIRNPLLAIGGFAKRLARETKKDDRGGQYANIIAKEAMRLERILNEIMAYSQAYEPAFVEEDVVSLVEGVIDEFGDVFKKKGIDVIRDFSQKDVRVCLDTKGITSVLRQFLNNSVGMIKNTDGEVKVSIQPLTETKELSIRISDNGQLIPGDVRNALLESNLSTKTFDGGLGLPMARKIIDAHNGRIDLKETNGGGNIVEICLPR